MRFDPELALRFFSHEEISNSPDDVHAAIVRAFNDQDVKLNAVELRRWLDHEFGRPGWRRDAAMTARGVCDIIQKYLSMWHALHLSWLK